MQKLRGIKELVFSKGMNNKDKPEFLKEGYCVLAENCLLGDEQIKKGPGTHQLYNVGSETSCLGGYASDSEIYSVFNNTDESVAILYRYTTSYSSPVAVSGGTLTKDLEVNFADTGEAVYGGNGVDATFKLVGATLTTPAGIPLGKYLLWFNNRLYIAGNPTYPNRIYYSDADAPDTFGANSYIEIIPSFRSEILGLNSVGGTMVLGKRDNIITFSGFTEDDFTVKALTEQMPNFGVTSHRSMVNTGDDLLFMSYSGGIPAIRSLKRTVYDKLNAGGTISDNIEGTMKNLNTDRLNQVSGGFDGRYVYFAVPYKTSTYCDMVLIYDTINEGFTVHPTHFEANVWFRSTILGSDRLFFGSAIESKILSVNHNISSRNTNAIKMRYISRTYRPELSRKSKFKYLYLTTGKDNNTTVNVSVSPDGYTQELQDTMNPETSKSVFPITFPFRFGISEDKRKRINLKSQPAYTYQIILDEESGAETNAIFPMTFPFTLGQETSVIIKEYDLHYYPRGLRSV